MLLSVAVQVVDSGFTLDPNAAARQFKIPPRNVRYRVQKLKEKMREEASLGPQGSRILADLLSGKVLKSAMGGDGFSKYNTKPKVLEKYLDLMQTTTN